MTMKTRLVLTRPHTHAGKHYQEGERIEIDSDLGQWLLSIGSAAPEPSLATTERQSTPEPKPFQRKEPKQ
jgi:hypothetical protein